MVILPKTDKITIWKDRRPQDIKMSTPYTTTTRLTRTDQPTGFEKVAQDNWDKIRDKQIRGYEDRTGAAAFRSFCEAVKRGAEILVSQLPNDKNHYTTMVCALGSYNILDGNKPSVIDKFQDNVSKLHNRKLPCALNDFLVKHNIFVAQGGIRTTGTVHYCDGTFDVVDPTKGVLVDGDIRKFKCIKMIHTPYFYLTRLSAEAVASAM